MNTAESLPESDERFQRLLVECLEKMQRGEVIDREQLRQEHPQYAESMIEFLNNEQLLLGAIAGLSAAEAPKVDSRFEPTLDSGATSTADSLPVGAHLKYIGEYEIVEEIARGGMGIVFKAIQTKLGRHVALKVILSGRFAGPDDIKRFYLEAEAAAQLDHPGIVPIFEIGEHEGRHYFSMALVDGESLADRVIEGPLPAREAAELLEIICHAVAYAHQQGVIHRDLKPANILIDAQGQPKVTDFGLAKRTETESDLTGTGQILGTPAYMPPEQASGKNDQVGRSADIYSLGAILYCLLTGRPPFQASTPIDTLLQIQRQEAVPPRRLNPSIPIDLETICLKCLEKEPGRRYQSADDLSAELQRFLSGRPILARPIGNLQRTWRWCQRNPALALSSGAVTLLVLAISIVAPIVAYSQSQLKTIATQNAQQAEADKAVAVEQRTRADNERDKAIRQQQIAETQLYASRISSAHRQWESNQAAAAYESHDGCRWDLRGWEHDYLNTLMNESVVCRGHREPLQYVSFSKDGEQIISGSRDLSRWNAENGELISTQAMHFSKPGVTITPDGSRVINANGMRGTIRIIDRQSGQDQRLIKSSHVRAFAVHPDQVQLAVATRLDANQGKLLLINLDTGAVAKTFDGQDALVNSLAFSADGSILAAGDVGGDLRTWNTATGAAILNVSAHTGPINAVACPSPDGPIYSAGDDNLIQCWDAGDGSRRLTLFGHSHHVTCLAVSSDGQRIVSGSEDTTVRLWDASTGKQLSIHRGHLAQVTCVAISPNGSRLVSGSADTNVRIWSLPAATDLLQQGDADVICLAVSHDGRRCAQNGGDGTIRIFDLQSREEIRNIEAHQNYVRGLAFSPDDRKLASCGGYRGAGAVKIWDIESGNQLISLDSHRVMAKAVAFNADGTQLVSAGGNVGARDEQLPGEVKIWDTSNGLELLTIELQESVLSAVAFSPDGSQIVTASQDITFWDVDSGQPRMSLSHPSTNLGSSSTDIAFSPDGSRIASSSFSSEIQVWDARDGRDLLTLRGHLLPATSVEFSPDGTRLFSSSVDRTIKVWDAEFGTELLSLAGHGDKISTLAIDPSGQTLISGSRDQSTRIWDASEPQRFLPLGARADGAMFSADLSFVVTFGDDTATNVWDTRTGRLTFRVPPQPGRVSAVALDRSHQIIAVAQGPFRGPNHVSLWQLEAKQKILTFPDEPNAINAVAITPDATMIAFGGDDGTVKVSKLPAGESMNVLSIQDQPIDHLQFSPAGSLLATGSRDGTIQVWNLSTGESVARFTPVAVAVTSLTFGLRGESLCSGHEDGSVHWFDILSGQQRTISKQHRSRVTALTLSNDGSRLISGSEDRTVRIWDVDRGQQLESLTGHQGTILAVRFSTDETSIVSVAQDPVLTVSSLAWRAWEDAPPRCTLRRWNFANTQSGNR